MERYFNVKETAKRLGLKEDSVRWLIRKERLLAIWNGSHYLISEKEVDRYAEEMKKACSIDYFSTKKLMACGIDKNLAYHELIPTETFLKQTFVFHEDVKHFLKEQPEIEEPAREESFHGVFTVKHAGGIHMRPSSCICEVCFDFFPYTQALFLYNEEEWTYNPKKCPAKALLCLGIPCNAKVHVVLNGEAAECMGDCLKTLFEARFGFDY